MHARSACLAAAALLIALPGCAGGGTGSADTESPKPQKVAAGASNASAALERAGRDAVRENFRLSLYVLWHNNVPEWASRSTRGPALAALRSAAADRRKEGIRIRSLGGQYRLLRLTLDPSYTRAVAIVRDRRAVVPYRAGRRLGRAIKGDERARIELRRLGRTNRFVVWRVSPVR